MGINELLHPYSERFNLFLNIFEPHRNMKFGKQVDLVKIRSSSKMWYVDPIVTPRGTTRK